MLMHVSHYIEIALKNIPDEAMKHTQTLTPTALAASMAFQAPVQGRDAAEAANGQIDAFLGLLDFSVVDTRPGARCAMAPPDGEPITQDGYRDLIRSRYRQSPAHRSHMQIMARRISYTPCTGPFAAEARAILEKIGP